MTFDNFPQSNSVNPINSKPKKIFHWKKLIYLFLALFFSLAVFSLGVVYGSYFYPEIATFVKNLNLNLPLPEFEQLKEVIIREKAISPEYVPYGSQEEAVIKTVKEATPAVVSVIISKDVPIIEEYYINPFEGFFGPGFEVPQYRQKGTEKKEVGGGSGFIISADGLVLTNRHVVLDTTADYTVLTNDGKKFPAKVLARDPVQDLAILKIEPEKGKQFSIVKLGDSLNLEIGQTVIAIGNALGEFRNTVSVGVISGLARTVTAGGDGMVETIEDVIQTDAAINQGNSGGPLFNLRGEVIGINTAMATGAENIGFAIPINKAKKAIESVKKSGKIVYPFLGVRYQLVTEKLKNGKNLTVDYGALLVKGDNGEPAVTPDSAADKAGLKEGDIILEFNGEKITVDNSLAKMIQNCNPGDKVTLKILTSGQEKVVTVILGERSE